MEKARAWAEAFTLAVNNYSEERDAPEALMKSAEIRFGTDSRIVAIPANAKTARGYSGNIVLDEFAYHEDPDAIWRAMYPSISNPLKRRYVLRIVSTFNGKGNKFFDLWDKVNGYSKHRVTIEDAVRDGLPVNIEELRAGLNDPEAWAQEYECEPMDSSNVLLPYDLIAMAESAEATLAMPPELQAGLTFCGIDFAGIARLFTPEQGRDEPAEVWYLFGAWILAAAMNATLTRQE
jgi:phage FluMu gp28-like protein